MECSPIVDASSKGTRSGGLPLIKELVADGRYLLSEKTYELLSLGYFELEDLEHSIQHGSLIKTESDELESAIGNKKYIIIGPDTCGYAFYSVGKLIKVDGAREYFVITAHEAEANYE